jgi:cytidylate kinase
MKELIEKIRELMRGEPLLVAIDGRSGVGKSTMARELVSFEKLDFSLVFDGSCTGVKCA